jgi:hypothetical protein
MDCNLSTVLIKLSYVLYCTDEIIVRRCPSEIILTMHRESEFTIWWKRRCERAPQSTQSQNTQKSKIEHISPTTTDADATYPGHRTPLHSETAICTSFPYSPLPIYCAACLPVGDPRCLAIAHGLDSTELHVEMIWRESQ